MSKKEDWKNGLVAIIVVPILFATPVLLMIYFDKVWSVIHKFFIVFVIIVFIKGEIIEVVSLKNLKIILMILFAGALFKMPYIYYEIMRFIGIASFILLSYNELIDYNELKKYNNFFMITWFASALLINPIFKLTLGRDLWNTIDVIWILLLLLSIKYSKNEWL